MAVRVRTALRYYGGKARIAAWVIAHLPPHTCYVEPFGGAASVLLRKQPARYEVYNDLDGEVVNFFRVLRDCPEALIRAVALTPFARAEAELACEPDDPERDPVERARRLYVRAHQTIHGAPRPMGARIRMGWRYEKTIGANGNTNVAAWNRIDHLTELVERLKAVQIEQDDALATIQRFDGADTLFYVDPPYVVETRGDRWAGRAYSHEYQDGDHERLAAVLRSVRGMVVLSGYTCPLYGTLYRDWRQVTRESAMQSQAVGTEVLWMNPAAVERSRGQLALFAAAPAGEREPGDG